MKLRALALVCAVATACGDNHDASMPDAAVDPCLACSAHSMCNAASPTPCLCVAGYRGDGITVGTGCVDINECSAGGGNNCVATNSTCTNTDGSFTCGCAAGFTGDGTTGGTGCTDINECMTGANNCVALTGTCTNTTGSFTCGCVGGFTGDGTTTGTGCADIDECASANDCDNFACVNTTGAFHCEGLYAVDPFEGVLARLDPGTFQLLDLTTLTASAAVTGVTSMKRHPTTGTVYGFAKVSGVAGRSFGTFDLAASAFTSISTVDNFSSMDFLPDGTLYAVTGNGASVPETLYTIDIATGAPTLYSALGNGADGEVICYNPDDSLMYHWSGNGTALMESFPLALPLVFTQVSGNVGTGEVFGCRYMGGGMFQTTDIQSHVREISSAGVVTPMVGAVDTFNDLRAVIPAPMAVPHTVRPRTGEAAGGTTVTIRGVGLSSATAVAFDGTPAASFTVVDDTTITAVTPAVAAGTVSVAVTTTQPHPATWPDAFTFVDPLLAPSSALRRRPTAIDAAPTHNTALQRKLLRQRARPRD